MKLEAVKSKLVGIIKDGIEDSEKCHDQLRFHHGKTLIRLNLHMRSNNRWALKKIKLSKGFSEITIKSSKLSGNQYGELNILVNDIYSRKLNEERASENEKTAKKMSKLLDI